MGVSHSKVPRLAGRRPERSGGFQTGDRPDVPAARDSLRSIPARVLEMHPRQRETYAKLIDAALEIYEREGYEGATALRLMAASNTSKQAFYNNFANRAAVFLDVYETVIGSVAESLREVAAESRSRPWEETLRLAIESLLDHVEARPGLVRVVLIEPSGAGPWAAEHHRERLALLPPLLDQGRTLSAHEQDLPPGTGAMALGSAITLLIEEYRAGFPRTREELSRDLYFSLLMPYVGPGDAARMTDETYAADHAERIES